MTLLQPAPSRAGADPAAAAPPEGSGVRRRWRWLAVAGGLAVIWTVLPLVVRLGQDATPDLAVDAGLFVPEYGETGTYFLHYEYGETVTVGVPVSNHSPLPLRVDGARLVEPDYPLLVPVGAGTEPVTLGPFESAVVPMTFEYANCRYYHERATQTLDAVVVSGSTLGRRFDEAVSFDHPLAVHAQVILDCPERTLVRGDDRRLPAPGRG